MIENTGTVNLDNLNIQENLASQYGAAYVNASGLTLVTPPTDPFSGFSLNAANFNGGSDINVIDTSLGARLAVGDSFVFQFTAEIDIAQASGVLDNTVTVGGSAVDANGNPLTDSSGAPITATDNSDSGADASSTNSGAPGDNGTSDDPTPLLIPSIGLAKLGSDPVPNGENFDVTYTLVVENNGTTALDNVEVFDNIAGQFLSLIHI